MSCSVKTTYDASVKSIRMRRRSSSIPCVLARTARRTSSGRTKNGSGASFLRSDDRENRDGEGYALTVSPRRRQGEGKGAAAAVGVGSAGQVPAVRLDDAPADGQAHAETLGLGGEEGVEDAISDLGLETDPGIADDDDRA